MVEVLDLFTESKEFSGLVKNVESGMEKNYVLGLSTSQKALYISGIFRQFKRQLIVVVENLWSEGWLMYFDSYATGKRIQYLRKVNGMTQEELAIKLNISDARRRAAKFPL